MSDDLFLQSAVREAVGSAPVPAANTLVIRQKMQDPAVLQPPRVLAYRGYVAAAVFVLAATFMLVPGASAGLADALRAIGVTFVAPPTPLIKALKQQSKDVGNITQAQSLVGFTLVAPRGLPSDARRTDLWAGPMGHWSAKTKKWSIGPAYATFTYLRKDGRRFTIKAERYDPSVTQYAYMWLANDVDASSPPKRYDRFAWRNGNQTMSVVADGITNAEIVHIREAMHGVAIPGVKSKGPHGGPRFYVIRATQRK